MDRTLQEYVLVAQDTPSVEIYRRTADGWERETYQGLSESLSFQSVLRPCVKFEGN